MKSLEISEKIKELKKAIEGLHLHTNLARDLIHELARIMNESKQVKMHEISIKIKEYLKEEIDQGKITTKWIEECLPDDYKRKYTKSEASSLSATKPTQGLQKNSYILNSSEKEMPAEPDYTFSQKGSRILDAVTATNKIKLNGPSLVTPKLDKKFVVYKAKLALLVQALEACQEKCYLSFDDAGILTDIVPDCRLEIQC